MKRRNFLVMSGAAAGGAALFFNKKAAGQSNTKKDDALKLTPPKTGAIPVAFLISDRFTVIDALGPWEVFQDVSIDGRGFEAFRLYTVAESNEPVTGSAGLQVIPNHTFADAPPPKVVVIGAQAGRSPAMFDWLRKTSETADVIMSVCTGAFILAQSGLIDGRQATTHHDFFERFEKLFPKVVLKRGTRFVEEKKFSSAGGLTSGIDLALRVVERYFGRAAAERTARYMEYQSKGWMV